MQQTPEERLREFGPPNRWWLLLLVATAYLILIQHRQLIGYIQLPLSEELGLTGAQAGVLDTAFLIPYALSQIFVASLSDRFQRRRVLALSLMASAICLLAMGFADSFHQLFVLRVVLGLAQSASVPAIAGVMADCFTPRNRSTAVGFYNLSLNLGVVLVGTFGGQLADVPGWKSPSWFPGDGLVSGWRLSVLFFGMLGVVGASVIALVMPEPVRTERDSGRGLGTSGAPLAETLKSVLSARSFVLFGVTFGAFCIVDNAQNYWLSRYYVEQFGMSNGDAGFFATIYSRPAAFVGLLLGGLLADRLSRHSIRGRVAVQVLGMLAWMPALFVLGWTESTTVLAATMLVTGLAYGFYVANLWTTTFDVVDPAARSTAIGLLNVIAVPAAFTSSVIGLLRDRDVLSLGGAISGLSIVAGLIVLLLVINALVLLPRDYRGPLSRQSTSMSPATDRR